MRTSCLCAMYRTTRHSVNRTRRDLETRRSDKPDVNGHRTYACWRTIICFNVSCKFYGVTSIIMSGNDQRQRPLLSRTTRPRQYLRERHIPLSSSSETRLYRSATRPYTFDDVRSTVGPRPSRIFKKSSRSPSPDRTVVRRSSRLPSHNPSCFPCIILYRHVFQREFSGRRKPAGERAIAPTAL